jgi:hypothetical protein
LHRGGHALGREAPDGDVGRGLDVLDAMAALATGQRRVAVEDLTHGAVADGVGRDSQASVVDPPNGAAKEVHVGPHRIAAVAEGVGLFEPGRAGVDHPVDHELDPVGAPVAPPAHGTPGDRLDDRLVG